MAHCVNRSSPEFKALAEQSNMNPIILAAKVSLWQEKNGLDNFPTIEDVYSSVEVNLSLKAVDILASQKAIDTFAKGQKNNWPIEKTLTELQVPGEQKQLILASGKTNLDDIITDLLANYSYAIEINTAKLDAPRFAQMDDDGYYTDGDFVEGKEGETTKYYSNLTVPGGTNYTENEIATPAITPSIKGHAQFATDKGIGWFRSDDAVEGAEIKTGEEVSQEYVPGLFEEENFDISKKYTKTIGGKETKTRRILEVQSDLFQKGRDKEDLAETEYTEKRDESGNIIARSFVISNKSDNQFLQLLNQGTNWVNFFVKSIIQDSAKKGYEKVLFPSGNTASKVEGHTTLEEFKKQKEDRIKELEKAKQKRFDEIPYVNDELIRTTQKLIDKNIGNKEENVKKLNEYKKQKEAGVDVSDLDKEINQLKQELERVEGPEGMGALKPIYNFYENTVKNILNKQYGKENVKQVTDEYGNTWNEVEIVPEREQQSILFQLRDERNIEASIKELDNYLLDFMKPFGVRSKEFDELKSRLGVDALGATDVLNKLIWYTKNRNAETIPEEVGHMATMLMGENHPDIKDLLSEVENWSEYKEIYDKYMPIYNNEKQVKIEAIGKLIARSLVKNYKESGFDKTLLQKALDAVTKFINNILNTTNVGDVLQYNSKVADHIALNILAGNKNYIANLKPATEKLNYKKALEGNPFAQKIISFFTGKGMKLTGSIAIAGQGETVYRNSAEPIHDIDFAVNSFNEFEKIQSDLLKMNAEPAHYGWDNKQKDYKTFAFVIPKPGFKINVIDRDFQRGNGWITNYEVLNNKGEVVVPTSQNHLFVDFFVYKNGEVAASNSIFKNFADIYFGKLTLGPLGNNERLFKREKDQTDYVLSSPKSVAVTNEAFRYLQSEDMVASKASAETVATMKNVAKQMGVDIQELNEYAKGNPDIDVKGINGLADLVKGVIAIAQGMEGYALTEEVVHMATAILEQTNPKLITEMISKINRFKIYDETLKAYKGKKAYQLSNGKPDIRKIKKEAVDKLIAELIVYQSEGSTQFPELLYEKDRSMVQKWWDTILDFIRGEYRKSNIDIFQQASRKVISGNVGGVISEITNGGVFYQVKNSAVDKIYDVITDYSNRLKRFDEVKDASGKVIVNRHYELDDLPDEIPSVTATLKAKSKMPERSDLDKFLDDQKKDWGTEIHDYIYKFITKNLIDKDGYKLQTPLTDSITNKLEPKVREKLEAFSIELINSYEDGTRFILEAMVVNEKVKGKLASAVDFMAIEPYKKEDGTDDVKVDILDWKTTSVNKSRDGDIHWGKQKDWKAQMGEYTKILYNYGLQPNQLRKARMIPFVINYNYVVEGKPQSGFSSPTSMEIGKLNSLEETHLYLLPVPINSESTGNPKIDTLLKSLREQWEKLYKKPVAAEDRYGKILEINKLSDAIRNLHVKLNFLPLVNVGKSFMTNARLALDDFAKIDYETISQKELDKRLGDLNEYAVSAMKFTSMDQVFLSEYTREGMTDDNKATLKELEHISSMAARMLNEISELQNQYAVHLGVKEGVTTEETKETILQAEKEIDGFAKTFLEGSRLSAKIIKLASNMLMNAKSLVNIEFARKMKNYEKLLIALEKEASAKGVKAFDLIGTMSPTGLNLIRKFDKQFWEDLTRARETGDKNFYLNNMNVDEYVKLANAAIEKGIAELDKTVFSVDGEEDELQRTWRKTKLRDSLDIRSENFDGYDNYRFKQLFRETMIEEGHYSKEYETLRKNKAAHDVWEFFTDLNNKAKQMGYLDKQGSSFFPLIEATMLQKFAQSDNLSAQAKESLWTDFYQTRINEQNQLSKIDPETGKVRKSIPKYYTQTDKTMNQLSTDLNKVGALWIKSLLEYESAKNLENTLLTLHAVEKAKGSLIIENGVVQFTDGELSVNEAENKNADILRTIIDDYLYKQGQDLGSIGNIGFSTLGEKLGKTEEDKAAKTVNAKKLLSNADTLTRALAVGLKPLIAAANFMGYNFQAFVNGGTMYSQNSKRTI